MNATNESTASKQSRISMFAMDPYDVFVEEENRGRYTPPSDDAVIRLAISMYEDGQVQPIAVRTVDGHTQVVAGFTRVAAARLLRTGFTYEGKEYHSPDFKILGRTTTGNDLAALRRNIAENRHRTNTTPMDDALNMERLMNQGMTEGEAAAFLGVSDTHASNLLKLLTLNEDERHAVATGHLTVANALELLKLTKKKRAAIIKETTSESGKIDSSALRNKVRESLQGDEKPEPGEKPAKAAPVPQRTLKEVKDYLRELTTDSPAFSRYTTTLLSWIEGVGTDRQLTLAQTNIEKALGGQ